MEMTKEDHASNINSWLSVKLFRRNAIFGLVVTEEKGKKKDLWCFLSHIKDGEVIFY